MSSGATKPSTTETNTTLYWVLGIIAAVVVIIIISALIYYYFGDRTRPKTCSPSCAADERCVSGRCVKICNPPCTASNECVDGKCVPKCDRPCRENEKCVDGQCQPIEGSSCTGPTCGPNQICLGQKCQTVACTGDGDCAPLSQSARCIAGKCTMRRCTTPLGCARDPSTGYSETCLKGYCLGINLTCTTTETCPLGTTCVGSKCVECTTDGNCTDGLKCLGGICTAGCGPGATCPPNTNCISAANICCPPDTKCGQSCNSGTDCGGRCPYCIGKVCRCQKGQLGQTCSTSTPNDCVSGRCDISQRAPRCLPPGLHGCIASEDCSPNLPWCRTGSCGIIQEGAQCDANKSCTGNYHCVNNVCTTGLGYFGDRCLADADCQSGLHCNYGTCTP